MLTRDDILQFLRDNKERFAEQYGVTKIGLFGSFARDEATEESDVDGERLQIVGRDMSASCICPGGAKCL